MLPGQHSFFDRVYGAVQKIPAGRVATYGDIARMIGTRDARRIGQALHANPDSEKTPCHRIVFADGSFAPGYVFGGSDVQQQKLLQEGITVTKDGKVNLKRYRFTPR